jgi:hypothetical protein
MDGGKPIARTRASLHQGLRRTEFNFAGPGLTRGLAACPAKLNSVRLSPGRVQIRCLPVTRWLILLAILVALPARLAAYTGDVFHWPQGIKPKHGLRLTVDTRWVDANGYRPVRVAVATWPPGPTLADRSIRVVLEPRNWRAQRPTIRVSGQIEIPEGATRGETILAIPQSDQWGSLAVSTYEDGQLLTDLSGSTGNSNFVADSSEAVPSILIVDSDAPTRDARERQLSQPALGGSPGDKAESVHRLPDVRRLFTLFPPSDAYGRPKLQFAAAGQLDDLATLRMLEVFPRIELLPPSELPTRWIDYSCFDLAFISRADLERLAAIQPPAWQAFRDWVASGPTLCVYEMELSDQRLAELEALLGMAGSGRAARDEASPSLWRTANPSRISEDIPALRPRQETISFLAGDEKTPPQPPSAAAPAKSEPLPFLYRPFYRGRIVAMPISEPLAAQAPEAAWMFNELGGHTWMWYQRHGVSLHRANDDYWNWLVPGIGRAPVGSFLILIAAFVVVIGPVNYFLLRRKRRLYLLLVTVPLGAALVTAALFAYALISDGLGVRVRVRSFTEIDQRAGRAVSWSRQSYYAGLAPSGGLTFPATAVVFPIEQYPIERQHGALGAQWLVWDDGQNLASGYISSRSTAQFLIVESGPSSRGVLVEAEAGAAAVWATNRLEATIDRLVVKDPQGRLLGTTQLAPGQRSRLEAIDPAAARRELAQVLIANAPAYPPGYNPGFSGASGVGFGYHRFWSNVDDDQPAPTLVTGTLERSLQATLNADVRTWPPRTYVALTRTSPGVSLGHGGAREEASFHVVFGTW